jgi:putative aldouronate transport system permease protein
LQKVETQVKKYSKRKTIEKIKKYRYHYFMFLPVFVMLIIFHYLPMVGIRYAFYEFTPFKKKFIGLENFKDLFTGVSSGRFWKAFRNTIFLSFSNIILGIVVCVIFALLLNEIYNVRIKRFVQTVIYLPHFLSWVVVASIFNIILSPQGGFVNNLLANFGVEPIYFLADKKWWVPIFLMIYRWKETGWGTIIYLAALTSVDPQLYEAAEIDGAGRWKQTLHITIPALLPTILVVFILDIGKILNIFEPIFVLYNDMVYDVADVIGTYSYRIGMRQANYGLGTAIGLFKSVVGMVLVLISNHLSKKVKGSGIL